MLGIHQQKCQELGQTIEYMSERQEQLLEMMERKQSLLKEAPDDFRQQNFQEIRELDERTRGEKNRPWKKCGRTGGTSKWRKGGQSLLLKVVSLG